MNSPSTHRLAVIQLAAAAALWSMGGLLIKLIPWPAFAITCVRSLIAAIVIFIFIKPKRLKFTKSEFLAAFFYCCTVTLFITSTKLTTAANAVFLQYTAPIYVAFLAYWFLNEIPTKLDIAVVVVVIFGMGLFFKDQISTDGMTGNILAIISGVTFASLTVVLRSQKDASPLHSIFLGNLMTAIFLSPFALTAPALDPMSVFRLTILGVFQLGLSYILYSKGVKYVAAVETMLISMIEPIFNPIWVLLLVGERPTMGAILGGTIIIAAIAFRNFKTA